ncbi:MAG: MBL fold metallo-hydrolase [Lachnospiraceae bacterium]|nr:MBL fold metallo-hydrolase [Lachnospiraceae bacterium]
MRFCALASGSSGNCIYVEHEGTRVLVDAGISAKRMAEALLEIGVEPESIEAMLITHDHTDHIQGAAVFSRKYGVDLYATEGTLNYICANCRAKPDNSRLHIVIKKEAFDIGNIRIEPFPVLHDAIDPVGYALCAGDKRLGVATDLGTYDEYIVSRLMGANALYIEANHDVDMLMLGSYPYQIKCRINSDIGHLSNEVCAELIGRVRTENMKAVVLAHISKENNFEELAYETVRQSILHDDRFENIPDLIIARRDGPTGIIEL